MADISKIKMPGSDTEYNIKDNNALRASTVGNGTTGEAVGWYECKLDNGKIKEVKSSSELNTLMTPCCKLGGDANE